MATPNSLLRSVGVLYASVVSPEYSVFSGLTTEALILLEDRSVGRVVHVASQRHARVVSLLPHQTNHNHPRDTRRTTVQLRIGRPHVGLM